MTSGSKLSNLGRGSLLADRAYEGIRDAIFANELTPGTQLSVPELARQLGVSRGPVREAVQRLIHDGLAVSTPYRGAMVAHVDAEDLEQLYEVRELLEGLAARLATERLEESSLAKLEDVLNRHQRVLDEGNGSAAHIELDMEFHRLLRELTGNRHLNEVLNNLQGKVHLALHSIWRNEYAPRLALEDHKKIFSAISSRDPEAAETAARAHIARLRKVLAETNEDEREDHAALS
jgi:DNA-binding GntR family transcriptional regulator